MRLLLDTHLAVWWQIAPQRISAQVRELVMQSDGPVFISRASLWELAIKTGTGKLHLDLPEFCAQVEQDGFQWLEIRQSHILAVAGVPHFEDKDPFDRLLVAQSLSEPLILLTTDVKLPRYGSTIRQM